MARFCVLGGLVRVRNIVFYFMDTIILKTLTGQGHSDPKMVHDTLPFQDAFTHQIWNSYLKKLNSYLKLEDLKVLRRSPDLLNNVKIGQGQLQLNKFCFTIYGGCRHFGQVT